MQGGHRLADLGLWITQIGAEGHEGWSCAAFFRAARSTAAATARFGSLTVAIGAVMALGLMMRVARLLAARTAIGLLVVGPPLHQLLEAAIDAAAQLEEVEGGCRKRGWVNSRSARLPERRGRRSCSSQISRTSEVKRRGMAMVLIC